MKRASLTGNAIRYLPVMLGCSLALSLSAIAADKASMLKVAVAAVESTAQARELAVTGDFVSVRTTEIAAEVSGVVTGIQVEAGDHVAQDAVLAVVREKPAQLRLMALRAAQREAKARVDLARINERRLSGLVEKKSVSRNDYDAASAELAQANATLDIRKAEADEQADILDRHRILAPFSGTVLRRDIEVGQWISAGEITFAVDDLSVLRAVLAIPQDYFGRIAPGARVAMRVDAFPTRPIEAVVSRVVPGVNRTGRTFEAWVEIANAGVDIAPGMSLRARIEVSGTEQGTSLSVPRDAVVKSADGSARVWRVNGAASSLTVSALAVQVTNAVADQLIVQASSLRPGDRVVVRGNESLREGAAVVVVAPGE